MSRSERVIGVREFRAHLSAYVREAAGGATVTIGDRAKSPLVRLVPATRAALAEHMTRLAESGIIQLGCGKPGGHRPVMPRQARRTLADLVIEDRR